MNIVSFTPNQNKSGVFSVLVSHTEHAEYSPENLGKIVIKKIEGVFPNGFSFPERIEKSPASDEVGIEFWVAVNELTLGAIQDAIEAYPEEVQVKEKED